MPASNDARGGAVMTPNSGRYLHSLDGRLRIKIPEIKRAPDRASALRDRLAAVAGVKTVTANSITGNVLIFYDCAACSREQLLDELVQWTPAASWVRAGRQDGRYSALEALSERLIEVAVRSTVEVAVRRLISAVL